MTGVDLDPVVRARGRRRWRGHRLSPPQSVARRPRRTPRNRRHGRHPGLLDCGLLRRRGGGDPARVRAEVRLRSWAATPAGVLGGITLVLYGMIGLLGAKIWIENRVSFADPINSCPISAGLIIGIGYDTTGFFSVHRRLHLGRHRARHDRDRRRLPPR